MSRRKKEQSEDKRSLVLAVKRARGLGHKLPWETKGSSTYRKLRKNSDLG